MKAKLDLAFTARHLIGEASALNFQYLTQGMMHARDCCSQTSRQHCSTKESS